MRGHEYFISTKFGEYPSSDFVVKADYVFPYIGSVPVDFLHPTFRVAHTKRDVISILMNKSTNINMYIIKKIISCKFILC